MFQLYCQEHTEQSYITQQSYHQLSDLLFFSFISDKENYIFVNGIIESSLHQIEKVY